MKKLMGVVKNTYPTSSEHEYLKALGWLESKHKRPISLAEIAERVGKSVGAAQAAVRSLQNKGYIGKQRPVVRKDNTVSGQLVLTDAGRSWL